MFMIVCVLTSPRVEFLQQAGTFLWGFCLRFLGDFSTAVKIDFLETSLSTAMVCFLIPGVFPKLSVAPFIIRYNPEVGSSQ